MNAKGGCARPRAKRWPRFKADLNVAGWRWIAGIHLNTPHPHVHIVIHKEVTDRNTASPRRLGNLPKRMLPHSERGADGAIRTVDGGVSGHFIAAMELAQERAREAEARQRGEGYDSHERTDTQRVPDLMDQPVAGDGLTQPFPRRARSGDGDHRAGPEPEPGERFSPTDDIQAALRNRSLDDSDYHTQIEQAGELG